MAGGGTPNYQPQQVVTHKLSVWRLFASRLADNSNLQYSRSVLQPLQRVGKEASSSGGVGKG